MATLKTRMLTALAVIPAGLLLGEAAVRPEQQAEAAAWNYVIRPQGVWCEGCCDPDGTVLCCQNSSPCSVAA
jgi:hypothetical protein